MRPGQYQLIFCLIVALEATAQQAPSVKLTSLKAESTRLICGAPEASTDITLKISFTGKADLADKSALVNLSGYVTVPGRNQVYLDQNIQRINLKSPLTLVKYHAFCGPNTVSGSETFAATILRASEGISFDRDDRSYIVIESVAEPTSQHPKREEEQPPPKTPQR